MSILGRNRRAAERQGRKEGERSGLIPMICAEAVTKSAISQVLELQQHLAAHEATERKLKEEYKSRIEQMNEQIDLSASREASLEDRVEELEAALVEAQMAASAATSKLERFEQKAGRLEEERCDKDRFCKDGMKLDNDQIKCIT